MQIGSSTSSSLPVVYRRDGFADVARQSERPQAPSPSGERQTGAGEITRIRTRASAAAERSDNGADDERLQNLPTRSRSALQSYLSNGPSIEERLGVELAGVDVFA